MAEWHGGQARVLDYVCHDQPDEGCGASWHLRRVCQKSSAEGYLTGNSDPVGFAVLVPVEALASEAVRIAVQRVVNRRPKFYEDYQYDKVVRLPGL